MTGIPANIVPHNVDGPSLVAAASGLMLVPENASRLLRLHRLAALGMASTDRRVPRASPSSVRSILKNVHIGGSAILMQEDPYSEVLVESISFIGGPYLVSAGSGQHVVADLENLIDAIFRERWMDDDLHGPARQLTQGLLTVSDMVLKRAGLTRGSVPSGSARTSMDVPGADRLRKLTDATFVSNDELDAKGPWLRMVVDTFALDPGQLVDPCADDVTDDRLYITPFLRLADGYRVVLPLDLLITIRFHLLRFVSQAGQLDEFGKRYRTAAYFSFMRMILSEPRPILLEESEVMSRHLLNIDERRDLHLIVATDPLVDWEPEVWGSYDTRAVLQRIADLVSPSVRATYSSAEELVHLVIVDSPGRAAFWGIPSIDGADPMLIARSDDLEVMLHEEPDGLLGLLLFAQAVERRPGRSVSTDILDEFGSYVDHKKSFYFSDDGPSTFTVFQTGNGLYPRQKYHAETDRHGVIPPMPSPQILQARRSYRRDAPEVFIIEPYSSYVGFVVEISNQSVFVSLEKTERGFVGVELDLLECVAYWVRECAACTGAGLATEVTELVVTLSDPESWERVSERSPTSPPVQATSTTNGWSLEFTGTFVARLQDVTNVAERALVEILLTNLFGVASSSLPSTLDAVAPLGAKRMLNAFNQNSSPDMLASHLPRALTGHEQVMAQVLDELGEWLRRPMDGAGFSVGAFVGKDRIHVLNAAVGHLFGRLVAEIALYDQRLLLDFLIAQNEALVHDARVNAMMLRSRLACFGEQSHTGAELVRHRRESASAQRANRFLIEYVAAQPPAGTRTIAVLDYYRMLALASEIIERATISDFLYYGLADFEISILGSGRLGVSRDDAVTAAIDAYIANSGARSIRHALSADSTEGLNGDDVNFDILSFVARSEEAMRAEFGFTLTDLREVCGGLLDLAIADQVTRIDLPDVALEIASNRNIAERIVSAVLSGISLTQRRTFLDVGPDAWPWRFNRDLSYVRRPLVLHGQELVFGFRSIRNLGPYWIENLLSGRLQGRARTSEMKRCISEARGKINDGFARSVSNKLRRLGMETRESVIKIGKQRILDTNGNDLGDIDVLASHTNSRSILAIEAKDFEIARTPVEIANEIEKLFAGKKGKKSTVELHGKRVDWLRQHLDEVVASMGANGDTAPWQVIGAVVTSDPLITPLVSSSTLPVIAFDDLTLDALNLVPRPATHSRKHKRRSGRR